MARYPNTNAAATPHRYIGTSAQSIPAEMALMSDSRFAPSTAGMERKNEKRTANVRSNPRSSPAEIVVPDGTGGYDGNHLRKANDHRVRERHGLLGLVAVAEAVGRQQQKAGHDEREADEKRVVEQRIQPVVQQRGRDQRERSRNQKQQQPPPRQIGFTPRRSFLMWSMVSPSRHSPRSSV